jgi:hypothetical protein
MMITLPWTAADHTARLVMAPETVLRPEHPGSPKTMALYLLKSSVVMMSNVGPSARAYVFPIAVTAFVMRDVAVGEKNR